MPGNFTVKLTFHSVLLHYGSLLYFDYRKWVNKLAKSWAPVANNSNPSYSEGRDQEDCGWKPTWQIVRETL
jgi:hypothetical protein